MGAPDGALPSGWGGGAGAVGDFVAGCGAGVAVPASLIHVGLGFFVLALFGRFFAGRSLLLGDFEPVAWFRLSSLAFACLSFDWFVLRALVFWGARVCSTRLWVSAWDFLWPCRRRGLVLCLSGSRFVFPL